ncbi:MAG: hemerythrin domain-containing protein [Magnetococcales bacterium]|nr:hemerythrin domain-containing protein [Magnetococcales bacterium]
MLSLDKFRTAHDCMMAAAHQIKNVLADDGAVNLAWVLEKMTEFHAMGMEHIIQEDNEFYPMMSEEGDEQIQGIVAAMQKKSNVIGFVMNKFIRHWTLEAVMADGSGFLSDTASTLDFAMERITTENLLFTLLEMRAMNSMDIVSDY